MKAVQVKSQGQIEVVEFKKPQILKDDDCLIKMMAASVNPIDLKVKTGVYPGLTPEILGCDGSGIIEEVGSLVQSFKKGDAVYFCHGGVKDLQGCYAEYKVVPERSLAIKPENLSFEESAAIPLVLITAWESLFDRVHLDKSNTILIHGGAGGVGHMAIQLAKTKNAQIATTIRGDLKKSFVKELGAHCIIDYQAQDFQEEILNWTEGKGVDIALDTVGGQTFFDTVGCVKFYGDIVTIVPIDVKNDGWNLVRSKNLRVSQELMLTPMLQHLENYEAHQAAILSICKLLFEGALIKIHLDTIFNLDEVDLAHQQFQNSNTFGKIVLKI